MNRRDRTTIDRVLEEAWRCWLDAERQLLAAHGATPETWDDAEDARLDAAFHEGRSMAYDRIIGAITGRMARKFQDEGKNPVDWLRSRANG